MSEGRKKPPRTLETPMMPANMPANARPPPGPEANVVIAQPEPKHYVHDAKPKGMSTGIIVMMSISGVLVFLAIVVGILVATGHLSVK
jgi:hypothetical protein